MSDNIMTLIVLGGYGIVAVIVILVCIFVNPEDDLCDICVYGLFWPVCLLLLVAFGPFKLLEMLQNKLLERRAKKKYYDENEDWYSEE